MKITVASGKGGTGKTMVTAALATIWDRPLVAVDLDVEGPNLHLFLRPEMDKTQKSWMEVPVLDTDKCNLCRECVDLCQFKAITLMLSTLNLYPDMCHGCGGCIAVCKEKALTPGKRELGEIFSGRAGEIAFLSGTLRIGEAMTPPLMEQVKKQLDLLLYKNSRDAIIDAPPGVSCPAICSVIDSDVIVLVTDATPFGFYDFKLAWESFSPLGKPMGVIINRAGMGTSEIYDFCKDNKISLLAEIPFDRIIAEAYSQGRVIAEVSPDLGALFTSLRDRIRILAHDAGEVGHA